MAMLARRLPYTVGLLVAGGALAFSPISSQVQLIRRRTFSAFLPPLIFGTAIHIPAKELRGNLALVLTTDAMIGAVVLRRHTHADIPRP